LTNAAVPEPAPAGVALIGLAVLGYRRRAMLPPNFLRDPALHRVDR